MAEILVVVVSYNNWRLTANCMFSLIKQTTPLDIILWDNNSPDGSAKELSKIDWPKNVTFVESKTNLLWAPAINEAIKRYHTDQPVIGFMNNDITLPSHAMEYMLKTLDKPNVGMVGPMGSNLGGGGDYATHKERWLAAGKGTEDDFIAQEAIRVAYLVGACVLFTKQAWEDIAPLDEQCPLGAEDHDTAIRLKDKGYEIWVNTNVYANHVGHASGDSPEWGKYNAQGWNRFNTRWAGYFATTDEARLVHWDGIYSPGWDKGTGWLSEAERKEITDKRVYPEEFERQDT